MERFKNGDKVCFIGDSLTAQNQVLPRIIDFYKQNFPNEKIEFINCGSAGGTASYAYTALEDDVFYHNPTHAVLAFGVNDSWRWGLEHQKTPERYQKLLDAFEKYKKSMTAICDAVTKKGIKLILCTPAPYAEYQTNNAAAYKGGYALMLGYADFVRNLAKEKNLPLCDYHEFLTRVMQTDDLYNDDCVHPTPHGYYYMAKCFLEFQGLDIGEEKEIPEYLKDWCEKVKHLRDFYSGECMIVGDHSLPLEERLEKFRDYIENGVGMAWFKELSKMFIDHHTEIESLREEIHNIYVKDVLEK